MSEKSTLIHWFRKDLRVHDNLGLKYIFEKANKEPRKYVVRPIYIMDCGKIHCAGANRWRFLQQSLKDLHEQLKAINSSLYVVRGNPDILFPLLFNEWKAELLTYEEEIEPFNVKRDKEIQTLAKKFKVEIKTNWRHTVYNPHVVIQKNLGNAPLTYQKFLSVIQKMKPNMPEEKPTKLICSPPEKDSWEKSDGNCYCVPSLEELVKKPNELGPLKFPGGESEALKRLNETLAKESWVAAFEKPKTKPNSLEPSTTALSPYLTLGCLSSAMFLQKLNDVLKRHPKHTQPPVSLLGQLMWREFYYTTAAAEPNFDRMMGNSFCLQIPWQINDELLEAWTFGRTGYPFIDAIMRQLRQEGWIHHLARHAVACFLTRGDLWISWEEGQNVFAELLIDHDWSLNAGNWMWLSASAFFHQYFRVYSPVAFGKKTDPTGAYIRKYVPELSNYPGGSIYEPWKVSLANQRKYSCIVGTDYPHRIVDHDIKHKENIKRMTAAYKVNREVKTGKTEDENVSEEAVGKRKAKVGAASAAAGQKMKKI